MATTNEIKKKSHTQKAIKQTLSQKNKEHKPVPSKVTSESKDIRIGSDGPKKLTKAQIKKAKKLAEKLDFRKHQSKVDVDRSTKRQEKFVRNNLSPGSLHKTLKAVEMEYQIQLPVGITTSLDENTLSVLDRLATTLNGAVENGININHGAQSEMLDTVNDVNTTINHVASRIPYPGHLGAIAGDVVSNVASAAMDSILAAVIFFTLTSAITYKNSRNSKNASILFVSFAILLYKSDATVVKAIKEKVITILQSLAGHIDPAPEYNLPTPPGTGWENQLDFFEMDTILEVIGIVVFTSIVGKAPDGAKLKTMFKECGSFQRSVDGTKNVARAVLKIVQSMTNYVRTEILGLSSIALVESSVEEVRIFTTECMSVADAIHKNEFPMNVPNGDHIHRLWTTGVALSNRYPAREHPDLNAQIRFQITQVQKIKAKFEQANILSLGTRQGPACFLIRGPSGVGKSAATVPLVVGCLAQIIPAEQLDDFRLNYESFVYGRQPEHVFWDGYRGQMVCAFDDFGQLRDVPGQGENEFSEFIRAGNIFGFILHMADIESKGGVAFRSKICICTTNLKEIKPSSIVEPEAVTRRFDLVVDQVPPKEYCLPESLITGDIWKRRLDKSKCRPGFDEAACEYWEYSFKTESYTGKVYSFDELVEKMVDIYNKHSGNHEHYRSELENIKTKYLRRRGVRDEQEASSQMEHQIDLDDILRQSARIEEIEENDDIFACIRDPMLKAFVMHAQSRPEKFREISKVLKELREKIFSQGMDLGTILETCVLFSTNMRRDLASFFERFEANHRMDVAEDPFFKKVLIHVEQVMDQDEACLYVRDNMKFSLPTKVVTAWTKSVETLQTFLKGCLERMKTAYSKFPAFKQWLTTMNYQDLIVMALSAVVASLATAVAIKGIMALVSFITGVAFVTEHQSNTKIREPKGSGKNAVRKLRAGLSKNNNMVHQMGSTDFVLNEVIDKVTSKNTYELWVNEEKSSGLVTIVKDRLALMPWHFVTEMALAVVDRPELESNHFTLKKTGTSIEFSIPIGVLWTAKQATAFDTLDACIVELPHNIVNSHANIVKHFMTHDTATKRRDKKFVLVCPGKGKLKEWHGETYQTVHGKVIGVGDNAMKIRVGYEYVCTSSKGDCGSLMCVVDNSTGGQKIIGIHTGGNPTEQRGFATAITQEDLLETIAEFEDTTEILEGNEENIEFNYDVDFVILDGRFKPLCEINKSLNMPHTTKIVKSRLHGSWTESTKKPARLSTFKNDAGELVDPFLKGLSTYCTSSVRLDPDTFKVIGEYLYEDIRRASHIPMEVRILTIDEAIIGIENDPDFGSIPRNTSAGFPWNLFTNPSKPGKTRFFGSEQHYELTSADCDELRRKCILLKVDAIEGYRQLHVFSDYLKDELRPIAKVDEGKTRIISATPLVLLIVFRQYFGAWTSFMTKNKVDNGSAVGLNPYSQDWHKLAQKLSQHGPKCGAGDYSKFDGSEKPMIHWIILEVIEKFYNGTPEDRKVRKMLWEELVNSRHLHGNKVYEWVSSLPSGHPLTTWINNMYNFIAFRYCWLRSHEDDPDCLAQFTEHVYLCCLGDDNVFNFSEECSGVFNQTTVSKHMAEIGLTYTDEMKNDTVVPFRPLSEVTFLKRSFRIEPSMDIYVAPLAMETILEMPFWTKKGPLRDSIVTDNVNTALMELSLHDPKVFNQWAPQIIAEYNKHYVVPLDNTLRSVLMNKSKGYKTWW